MLDIMESSKQGDAIEATSIDAMAAILDGNPATGRLADVMSVHGLPRLYDRTFLAPTEIEVVLVKGVNAAPYGFDKCQAFVTCTSKYFVYFQTCSVLTSDNSCTALYHTFCEWLLLLPYEASDGWSAFFVLMALGIPSSLFNCYFPLGWSVSNLLFDQCLLVS